MNRLTFLTATESLLLPIEWPDVYFTPHYGRAVEQSDIAEWEIAVWGDGSILFPYLKRPVEPELAGEGYFDIVSPYGYSGTWIHENLSNETVQAFRAALRETLRQRGCVAEFQRLSSLVTGRERLLEADAQLLGSQHNSTVSINIGLGYEALWAKAEGRCRTKTRKARKLGYTWSCRPFTPDDAACGSEFRMLYESTMDRVGANPYYIFPTSYYQALATHLDNRVFLLQVDSPLGEPVVVGLFVDWQPLLHLHLMGSHPAAIREGAGNMAYDGLIQWACAGERFLSLHVGGGMTPDDSMFYFKRGFGGETLPFWTARSVINPEKYAQCVRTVAAQRGVSVEELEASGYFPAYRAPLAVPAVKEAA